MHPVKNRLTVWRYRGSRLRTRNIVPTFKSGYQTVSVCGGFSIHGQTSLVGTIGNFDRNTYRVIIDNQILPFIYDVHGSTDTFVLQENNCSPHRTSSSATYLRKDEVTRMKWPAQSPDLNPIENVWGSMKSRLRKRSLYPTSPMHLFSILNDMWNNLPDEYFKNLVESIYKRAKMVLHGKGRSTKY